MRICERDEKIKARWGQDQIVLTVNDILALLSGKKLVTEVCSEYVVSIWLEVSE